MPRAATTPAGAWIEGRGYDDTRLAERRHPTRYELDAATHDHPVQVHHVSGHMSVVNSRALELAGIGRGTPDPQGGRIDRDPASGEPTGLLQEQAQSLYGDLPKMPAEAWAQFVSQQQNIPSVMGGYLEKGAKAVIDMQEELRSPALKLFSGFPYSPPDAAPRAEEGKPRPKAAAKARARKPRRRKAQ